jgi:RNA polymerase sigma factor (sigma-70 family)
MGSQTLADVLKYVRHLGGAAAGDAKLLEQFVTRGDEGAFAALLQRHGPLVLGVCRQVLRDAQDAEDAFQATFLVLARKAASIRKGDALAGWLHRVALNVARTTWAGTAQRRARERQAPGTSRASPVDGSAPGDWRPLIHEEVGRLPEKYRLPVVLCYFGGKTHAEAARELAWPLGTVKGRLARARDLLRTRLARRGLALSGAALAAAFAQGAVYGQVSADLFCHTLRAAVSFAAGEAIPAGDASAQAVTLAKGALPLLAATRPAPVLVLVAAVGLIGFAAALGAGLEQGEEPGSRAAAVGQAQSSSRPVRQPAGGPEGADVHGDPLPPGARARAGTTRFRHGGPVLSLAYLARGKILASAGHVGWTRADESAHGTIRLWEAATGKELRRLHVKGVANVAVSPDGATVAGAGTTDGTVFLWDAATGKELRRFKGSRGYAGDRALAFSPDGRTLAATGADPYVRLWDVATGKLLRTERTDEPVLQLAFSPDGRILGFSGPDQLPLRLFAVATWKELPLLPAKHDIRSFAFSPDGKTLAGSEGGLFGRGDEDRPLITLYELATGRPIRRFQGHRGTIHTVAFTPDGKTLASAASDKTIRLWEVATGKQRRLWSAGNSASTLALAPDGKTLAAAHDGVIRSWDLATGKALPPRGGHQGGVSSVALSPDGKTLISASSDATIRSWEAGTGKELRRLKGHEGSITSVSLSPDGKLLASVCPDDRTVGLWDVAAGREVSRFPASPYQCQAAWSPDGKTLFVGRNGARDEPTLYAYDVGTGKELRNVVGAWAGAVLVVSPDGKLLATGATAYPTFHLREAATGKKLPPLPVDGTFHQGPVTSAAFSPDGKRLFTGSPSDRAIRLWEIAAGKELLRFLGHKEEITCLALSPDGRTLASGSRDRTVRLWDAATGKERRRLPGHQGWVTSLAWSGDGKTLASGSADGTALLWDVAGLLRATRP